MAYLSLTFVSLVKGFTTPKPPTCQAPLGMQNNQIPDSALRASSSYNMNSMGPRNGRLHFQASSGQYGAWAVSTNNAFQYFEVNFGEWTMVTKVATQGRQDGGWWVTSYSLSYSYDGVFLRITRRMALSRYFMITFLHCVNLYMAFCSACCTQVTGKVKKGNVCIQTSGILGQSLPQFL